MLLINLPLHIQRAASQHYKLQALYFGADPHLESFQFLPTDAQLQGQAR